MNITEAFADFLEAEEIGVFGTNLFIGGAPLDGPDLCFWLVSSGGAPVSSNQTNEMVKEYTIDVFYRNTDPEDVYDVLQSLEILLNNGSCKTIGSFDIIDVQTSLFPTDQDIDNEDRTVGLLTVKIVTYYKE